MVKLSCLETINHSPERSRHTYDAISTDVIGWCFYRNPGIFLNLTNLNSWSRSNLPLTFIKWSRFLSWTIFMLSPADPRNKNWRLCSGFSLFRRSFPSRLDFPGFWLSLSTQGIWGNSVVLIKFRMIQRSLGLNRILKTTYRHSLIPSLTL